MFSGRADTKYHYGVDNLKIYNDRNLFYALAGLVSSGANAYDHSDTDVSILTNKINKADISDNVKTWFCRARTGCGQSILAERVGVCDCLFFHGQRTIGY